MEIFGQKVKFVKKNQQSQFSQFLKGNYPNSRLIVPIFHADIDSV